jgi:hypothetical protein
MLKGCHSRVVADDEVPPWDDSAGLAISRATLATGDARYVVAGKVTAGVKPECILRAAKILFCMMNVDCVLQEGEEIESPRSHLERGESGASFSSKEGVHCPGDEVVPTPKAPFRMSSPAGTVQWSFSTVGSLLFQAQSAVPRGILALLAVLTRASGVLDVSNVSLKWDVIANGGSATA